MDILYRSTLDAAFGPLQIAVDANGILLEIWLPRRGLPRESDPSPSAAARSGMAAVKRQLDEYLRGTRRSFDLQLDARGSAFERVVWKRLYAIPYGETTSYGAIAAELDLKNGARAVGRANGANPIPIVIPCHRVIGSDGTLTGYGGGLPLKRALLELEGAVAPLDPRLF
jgi:methylated-DNA-[protein]-cysteine S-methyltransferase